MKRNLVFKVLLMAFLAFLIGACKDKPVEKKSSAVLNDKTCALPCWAGIYPGTTTYDEVKDFVNSSDYIADKEASEYVADENRSQIRWQFPSNVSEKYGRAHIFDGIVRFIQIDYENGPTFNEIVENFGEPDEVSAMVHYADCGYAQLSIKYSQIGLVASRYMGCISLESGFIQIKPDYRITEIQLFIPGTYDELVLPGKVMIVVNFNDLSDSLQDWQGFGDIKLYIPE
jgi:hypothetical protein